MEGAQEVMNERTALDDPPKSYEKTFHVNLKEKNEAGSSLTLREDVTNEALPVQIDSGSIQKTVLKSNIPAWLIIYEVIMTIGAFYFLFAIIAVPVLFYLIIGSVTRGRVLEQKMLGRCRKLGWFVVSLYVYLFLFKLYLYLEAVSAISLADYVITFKYVDFELLFLGCLILLVAEVLNVTLKMKEEQDLTI